MKIGKYYKIDVEGKSLIFSVSNINNKPAHPSICINIYRGWPIKWLSLASLEAFNPVEVESPHKQALAKALKLKVGEKVKYLTDDDFRPGSVEGEILEIWGSVEETTYSFKISCENSWYHIYPYQIIWPDEVEHS